MKHLLVPTALTAVIVVHTASALPAAHALTSGSITPANWYAGQTQSLTFTMTGAPVHDNGTVVNSFFGVWDSTGSTWVLDFPTPLVDGTLDKGAGTLDCGNGITYQSDLFKSAPSSGTIPQACEGDGEGQYFLYTSGMAIPKSGTTTTTVVMNVPAGMVTAPPAVGQYSLNFYACPGSWNGCQDFSSATVTVGAEPDPVEEAAPSGIVVRQGVPMPSTGSCDGLDDVEYAWGTGISGGWQRAWEPWAGNEGARGGWACIRALKNTGGHQWSIDDSAL